jgi:hypothetical protein
MDVLDVAGGAILNDPTGRTQDSLNKTFSCCDRKNNYYEQKASCVFL